MSGTPASADDIVAMGRKETPGTKYVPCIKSSTFGSITSQKPDVDALCALCWGEILGAYSSPAKVYCPNCSPQLERVSEIGRAHV